MVEPVNDNILNLVNELYNNLDAKDKIINEQALEILMNYLTMLNNIPQQHYDKWVLDYKKITDSLIRIDPSKESNFFYDNEKGFSFIDLNFFAEKPIFNKVDNDGKKHHAEFILYTILPFMISILQHLKTKNI